MRKRLLGIIFAGLLAIGAASCGLPTSVSYDCKGEVTDAVENTAGDSVAGNLDCQKQ